MIARLLLLLALLLAAFGMSRTFGEPFGRGWLGNNGARYAQIARNYDRHGFLVLGGAPLLDAGEPPGGWRADGPHDVYAHHPPGLSLGIGLLFRIFGVSEDVARLLPVFATLLALVLLARLVGHVAGPEAGGFAALAASCQPMLSVYGAHIDVQGAPVLCASLGVLLCYRRWLLGGDVRPLLLVAALASALDWYGLYAPALCAAHAFVTQPERRRGVVLLGLWPLLLFGSWLAWLAHLPGQSAASVLSAAGLRGAGAVSGGPAGGEALAGHLSRWLASTLELMPGWPALLLVAVGVLCGAAGRGSRAPGVSGEPIGPRGLIVLLMAPVLHALLFPAGLLQHSYWLFGLPLPLAAAFGLTVTRLRPVVAVAVTVLVAFLGLRAGEAVLGGDKDELPALVGRALAAHTEPQDVILTNYEVNPFAPGSGDEFIFMRPAVTFYADRAVRGGIDSPEALGRARERRPDAGWFLAVPLPAPPAPELLAAVARTAAGPPLQLSNDPPAQLTRLRQ